MYYSLIGSKMTLGNYRKNINWYRSTKNNIKEAQIVKYVVCSTAKYAIC